MKAKLKPTETTDWQLSGQTDSGKFIYCHFSGDYWELTEYLRTNNIKHKLIHIELDRDYNLFDVLTNKTVYLDWQVNYSGYSDIYNLGQAFYFAQKLTYLYKSIDFLNCVSRVDSDRFMEKNRILAKVNEVNFDVIEIERFPLHLDNYYVGILVEEELT